MTKNDLVLKAKEMIKAPSCCPELHAVAQAWIDSVGKADEKTAQKISSPKLKRT